MKVVVLALLFIGAASANLMFRRMDPKSMEYNAGASKDNGMFVVDWMGSQGAVCADGVDVDAIVNVACGGSGSVSAATSDIPATLEFVMTKMECSGSEDNIGKCKWTQGSAGDCSEAVVATCSKKREIFWSNE